MTCSSCGNSNPGSSKFCAECGERLQDRCAGCGAAVGLKDAFCSVCGSAQTRSEQKAPPARPADATGHSPEAERRHITVMFCDLTGSTELSQQLDPEDLRELLRAYQASCADVVRDLDGEIAQYLGDGILVYFGSSRAHEDDPMRAVRAGLAVVAALPRLNDRLAARFGADLKPLQAHIAIHSGPVVVGEMGGGDKRERLAVGDTVNTAARILDCSEPGSVVISGTTRELVQGIFVLREIGLTPLRGLVEPVELWEVVAATGMESRFDVISATGHTPLVGRKQEIDLLLERWEQVNEGQGQAALLSGEPGIGKTRLVQVLRAALTQRAHTWLECHCSAYHEGSVLHPVVELLQVGMQISPDDSAEERFAKLERSVASAGLEPGVTPALAGLLSIPTTGHTASADLGGEAQRRETLEALSTWLFSLTELQPVVLVMEDLHWCDPSTLELLTAVLAQVPAAPILLVATFRPEFKPPWESGSHIIHLPIHPLTRRQTAAMVANLCGEQVLPEEVVAQVIAKTDGVPLFVEEFTKAVVESEWPIESSLASDDLREIGTPSTLQASLMARIDRLGPAKELLQLSSVIGREFSYELLAAVSPADESTLEVLIERLIKAELVYQRGLPPKAVYTFKHALIQDVAYQSQLRSRRQQVHARIVSALEQHFPEIIASAPEVPARHCEEAMLLDEAAAYCLQAGERSTQLAANDEAIAQLKNGIELLGKLPRTPERDRQELLLQLALGVPLQAARGNADPEVEAVYERARELCSGGEDSTRLFRALRGLFAARQVRAELDAAIELGKELLDLAERAGETSELLQAHLALGSPYLWQGRYSEALEHLDSAIELYVPSEHHALAYVYGLDQGVNSRAYAAIALYALGHCERAVETSQAGVALARKINHPYSLATALGWAAGLHQMRGEPGLTLERAEEGIEVSRSFGFPTFLGVSMCYRGWAMSNSDGPAGVAESRAGLDELASSGTLVGGPQLLAVLADANRLAGRVDEALELLNIAQSLAKETGQSLYDAELYRLKAELIAERDGSASPEVEALYRQALKIARAQQAKSYELRTAMSLGQLLRTQGEPTEARELIAGVTSWFSGDFDTPDLRGARALLAAWSSS